MQSNNININFRSIAAAAAAAAAACSPVQVLLRVAMPDLDILLESAMLKTLRHNTAASNQH
jgi:hypothetical protein